MIRLLSFETTKEKWFQDATELYSKKIKAFYAYERTAYKSLSKDQTKKQDLESRHIIEKSKDHYLIICDESGENLNSRDFSSLLVRTIESGHRNIDFAVGGAFGFNDEIKKRADKSICLAPFVMNHLVAQVVLMEQIYRAFTIWKGLPYHNE